MTDRTPVPEPHATTNNVNQQHQSVTTSDIHAKEEECHVSSTGELNHFTDVYRGSLDRLFALVSQIESLEAYEGLLIDAPSNYFFNHAVTVENLVRHLVAAESHWLALLPDLPIGEPVTLPSDIIVTDEFERDHVETFYLSRIEDALKLLFDLPAERLDEEITFRGTTYSKSGFLWMLIIHNVYHYGQIELLMRQRDVLVPEALRM